MPTVGVNGIEIYYEQQGSGPPLLFVNGSGATLATSGMLVAPFAGAFDVLAHDQRGLGRTGVPSGGLGAGVASVDSWGSGCPYPG